jgi:competence protein ComEA
MFEQRRARMASYALAGVLVITAGVSLFSGPDKAPAPPIRLDGPGITDGQGTPPEAARGGRVFVHVAGEVRDPGLYRMAADSRAGDAVERAGGPTRRADTAAVNLAASIEDGQQLVLPRRGSATALGAAAAPASVPPAGPDSGEDVGPGSPAPGGAATAGPKPSLATATAQEIDVAADGIGPTLAQRIVDQREQNGGFSSVEQLREVPGIGEVRYQALAQALAP